MAYPFSSDQTMVRDRWYIAAFSDEITRDPMERTILGKPVAFYRKQDGSPVAMYGLCPHRYFPLAKGQLKNDALVCGYHGFTFDSDGKCIDIPSQGTGAGFCQPTYPILERGPLCWIWMGDADRCDPALIPPYDDFGLDQPGWRTSSFNYFHLRGRYSLLVDNLLDLTHLPLVHHHIPGGDHIMKTPMSDEERGGIYYLLRKAQVHWSHFHEMIYGPDSRYHGKAKMDNVTAFYGPELIRTGLGHYTEVEGLDQVPAALGRLYIMHGITPETDTSTHYFGFSTRDFRLDDPALDELQLASDKHIRQQDVDAIDAVELRLDQAVESQRELLAKSDAPAIKVRARIQAMLDAEVALSA